MVVPPEIMATHRVPCALKVHIKSSFWVRGESRGVICSGSGARRWWWQSRRWHHPHKLLYSRHILPKSGHLLNQIRHRSRSASDAKVSSLKLARADKLVLRCIASQSQGIGRVELAINDSWRLTRKFDHSTILRHQHRSHKDKVDHLRRTRIQQIRRLEQSMAPRKVSGNRDESALRACKEMVGSKMMSEVG